MHPYLRQFGPYKYLLHKSCDTPSTALVTQQKCKSQIRNTSVQTLEVKSVDVLLKLNEQTGRMRESHSVWRKSAK